MRAVFSTSGEDYLVAAPGMAIDGYVLVAVGGDNVVLRDPDGIEHRVALRGAGEVAAP